MGDILPPKRQTIVDRLRRRIELYCRNQSTCLPRSQQRTNGLSTQQTHQLKRGHLENQVKTSSPCQKSHPRLTKRSREFIEDLKDPSEPEKHRKNPRHKDVPFQGSLCSTQEEEKDIPSFSVQIVQQFTKVPHSQTIQTNVTVKAVPPTKGTQSLHCPVTCPLQKI
ncbi:uncharacterized protein LOC143230256 [Tachypleus tridentatus]|uniref:uncharacterized protein LOC143230256 n=1 Tax=Tachypleus tridentatus TaxID=6853 RepID=UPI003FCF4758